MTVIPGLSLLLKAFGKRVKRWDQSGDCLQVEVSGAVRRLACPSCLHRSSQVHGSCPRQLADLPSFGHRVTLSIDVRRFNCVNPNFARRTFSPKLDSLAAPSQRRTHRLSESVRSLGYSLGGAAATCLASRLGVGTSGDTLLRELRHAGCAGPATSPVVVGVRSWPATALARIRKQPEQPVHALSRLQTAGIS